MNGQALAEHRLGLGGYFVLDQPAAESGQSRDCGGSARPNCCSGPSQDVVQERRDLGGLALGRVGLGQVRIRDERCCVVGAECRFELLHAGLEHSPGFIDLAGDPLNGRAIATAERAGVSDAEFRLPVFEIGFQHGDGFVDAADGVVLASALLEPSLRLGLWLSGLPQHTIALRIGFSVFCTPLHRRCRRKWLPSTPRSFNRWPAGRSSRTAIFLSSRSIFPTERTCRIYRQYRDHNPFTSFPRS